MSEQELNQLRAQEHITHTPYSTRKIKCKNYAKQENKDKELGWNPSDRTGYLYQQPKLY